MKIDYKRTFYYLGTALILLAIAIVTFLPYFAGQSFYYWCPVEKIKITALRFYFAAFILYLFSLKYFKKQITILILCFIFFLFFQFLVKNF